MKSSGIYRIRMDRSGDGPMFYVGQAVSFYGRRAHHLRHLRSGKHKNVRLQKDFDLYGEAAFHFEPLLVCEADRDILTFYEQTVLNSYDKNIVYNVCLECVGSRLGLTTSQETRAKQSAAALGRKASQQTRARISAARRGWNPPPAHVEHLRQLSMQPENIKHITALGKSGANRGKKKSPEELARRHATRLANAAARGYY